jgi:dephospho-CoA kinase
LERLGAATLSTDDVAHEVLGAPDVLRELVGRWGPDVARDGNVDRARVGEIVFSDTSELRWLESITHPKVGERVVAWRTGLESPAGSPLPVELGVVEVPLLFEAGMEGFFDGVLVVVAGARRAGWLEARGDAGVDGRAGRQMTEEEKAERATWVVANDGTLQDLESKLREMWPQLVAVGSKS